MNENHRFSSELVRGLRLRLGAAVLVLLGACGYTVIDESAVFGPEIRVIQLGNLENRTTEVGFEAMLVDALQEEFVRRGVLVPQYGSGGDAEGLALEGTIVSSQITPTAFSSITLTLEDQVEVRLSVSVRRLDNGKTVLDLPSVLYSERFLASADPQIYESNKEQALRRISARAANQIHDVLFQQRF